MLLLIHVGSLQTCLFLFCLFIIMTSQLIFLQFSFFVLLCCHMLVTCGYNMLWNNWSTEHESDGYNMLWINWTQVGWLQHAVDQLINWTRVRWLQHAVDQLNTTCCGSTEHKSDGYNMLWINWTWVGWLQHASTDQLNTSQMVTTCCGSIEHESDGYNMQGQVGIIGGLNSVDILLTQHQYFFE